jgi:hypothetical protein
VSHTGLSAGARSGIPWHQIRRLASSMLLLALVALPIWIVYGFASGSLTFFGNCGGKGLIGYNGHYVGGSASTAWAAAAIGGVLLSAAAAETRRREARTPVVLAFVGVYVASLVVLALVAPLVWGSRHCALY